MKRSPNSRRRGWNSPKGKPDVEFHHLPRREGDEVACSCGLRWPIGEEHP